MSVSKDSRRQTGPSMGESRVWLAPDRWYGKTKQGEFLSKRAASTVIGRASTASKRLSTCAGACIVR